MRIFTFMRPLYISGSQENTERADNKVAYIGCFAVRCRLPCSPSADYPEVN
ncbi:hypothetical protein D1AOALGA4SA_10640 [Olavius algarvensis Delta 1 endosymbiont]|nr:hypothetical protein D1AOALGA4SA_10640 [Olavius algarvensis Delta 1 endosymbiont]